LADDAKDIAAIFSLLEAVRDFNGLEEACLKIARDLMVKVLETLDEILLMQRPKGYRVAGFKKRTIATRLGDITYVRRLYVKATKGKKRGKGRFLVDEVLNIRRKRRVSGGLLKLMVSLATRLPFRQAAEVLEEAGFPALSHGAIHREVRRYGQEQAELQEELRHRLFTAGQSEGEGQRTVPILFIEADGVMVNAQRSDTKRLEIKVALVHEGWERKSPGSKELKLINPRVYIGLFQDGESFWEALSVDISKRYNLAKDPIIVLNGDGASWIQDTARKYFPNLIVQLDRFHLFRDIRKTFDDKTAGALIQALQRGQVDVFLDTMESLIREGINREARQRRKALWRFCCRYRDHLVDYRQRLPYKPEGKELYGMGAIETIVDKKVANRMKKRGMSWSRKGALAMAALLMLKSNGELFTWLDCEIGPEIQNPLKILRTKTPKILSNAAEWLQVSLPALRGPCQSKHWIKLLSEIAYPKFSVA